MMNSWLNSIGTGIYIAWQKFYISGHMDYTLRNNANESVQVHCIYWKIKHMPPLDVMGIPGTIPLPVDTGNIINLIGQSIYEGAMGTGAFATNTMIDNAELELKDLPLFNKYISYKIVKHNLAPGQIKRLKIGIRRQVIDVQDLFYTPNPTIAFTNTTTWARSFVPGAKGILFRAYANPAVKVTDPVVPDTNNSSIVYTQPEMILTTKTIYYLYNHQNVASYSQHTFAADTGIVTKGTGIPTFINPDTAAVVPATNA